MAFIFVGLGGALGAMARYAISLIPNKTGFPYLTLITNVLGAVLIGFIVGYTGSRKDIPSNTVLFWKTGVCGGFTTFSTFSLEAYQIFEKKSYGAAGLYSALSLVLCLAGVWAGIRLSSFIKNG
jgi:CrcB protein